ncbi:hypothetical protein ANTRET_LOCUS2810 [Anthophora retusa]
MSQVSQVELGELENTGMTYDGKASQEMKFFAFNAEERERRDAITEKVTCSGSLPDEWRIDAAKRAFRFHSRRAAIPGVSHRSYKPASSGEQPNEPSRPAKPSQAKPASQPASHPASQPATPRRD